VAAVGEIGHRERAVDRGRAHEGQRRVGERLGARLEPGHLAHRRAHPVAGHHEVGLEGLLAVRPLDHDPHDAPLAVAHEVGDGVLVDDRQVARERQEDLADLHRHRDGRSVRPRGDVPAAAPDLVEDADLLQGRVALVAEHVAARDVRALGHPLDHDRLHAAQAKEPRKRHADHPAA
jgi:hypothetical protein